MPWRNYLRSKTRQPAFLWRLTLGILMAGALVGYAAQWLPDSVEKGLREPDTTAFNENYDQVQQLVAEGDWSGLWWAIPRSMWLGWLPGPATIAVITGLCWLAFTIQAGQPSSPGGIRWWLALLAVGLGVVSIWPTLFAVYWQEEVWGLEDSKDLIGGLRFYILGVGLREELSKLLLFLPLLPWVLRRGSEREALLVAACVGLGFAMEENVQCFMSDPISFGWPIFNRQLFAHVANRAHRVGALSRHLASTRASGRGGDLLFDGDDYPWAVRRVHRPARFG